MDVLFSLAEIKIIQSKMKLLKNLLSTSQNRIDQNRTIFMKFPNQFYFFFDFFNTTNIYK